MGDPSCYSLDKIMSQIKHWSAEKLGYKRPSLGDWLNKTWHIRTTDGSTTQNKRGRVVWTDMEECP